MQLPEERAALVEYCLRMQADDLTVGTSGNLSVRSGHLIAITPSGVVYDDLTPEAICVIDLDGNVVEADLDPSSEVPMHTSVYRATDAGAVVHSHPMYCTALSVTLDEVPPVHYMLALLGGPVRVAPYARFAARSWPGAAWRPWPIAPGCCCATTAPPPTATRWRRPTPARSTWSGCASSTTWPRSSVSRRC